MIGYTKEAIESVLTYMVEAYGLSPEDAINQLDETYVADWIVESLSVYEEIPHWSDYGSDVESAARNYTLFVLGEFPETLIPYVRDQWLNVLEAQDQADAWAEDL